MFVVVNAEFLLSTSTSLLLVSLWRSKLNMPAVIIALISIAYYTPLVEGWMGSKFRKPTPDGCRMKKYTVKATKLRRLTIVRILLV